MTSKPLTHLQGERAELSLSPEHSQMMFPILKFFLQAMLDIHAQPIPERPTSCNVTKASLSLGRTYTLVTKAVNSTAFFFHNVTLWHCTANAQIYSAFSSCIMDRLDIYQIHSLFLSTKLNHFSSSYVYGYVELKGLNQCARLQRYSYHFPYSVFGHQCRQSIRDLWGSREFCVSSKQQSHILQITEAVDSKVSIR